jgi:lipoprotein-anchoring transpeptidase ErfK/SrfK
MRKRTLAALLAAALAVLAVGADLGFAIPRSSAFDRDAAALQSTWDHDIADGVPASSIAPLREQLSGDRPGSSSWSPAWVRNDGRALLADLQTRTDSAWQGAMAAARQKAQRAVEAYTTFAEAQSAWLPADVAADARRWPSELAGAATPAALNRLATGWTQTLGATQAAVEAAKTAHFTGLLEGAGGRAGLLRTAENLVETAHADNLDGSQVEQLMGPVKKEADDGRPPSQADVDLLNVLSGLQGLIDLNDSLATQMIPTYYTTLQARAQATPSANAFGSEYQGILDAFHNGRTAAELTAVQQRLAKLTSGMGDEIQAHNCGFAVPSGKAITINLTVQEMLFYQDGCVVRATPVTTGRPNLRTPTGSFHVFYKQTNFVMHSAWPKSSPYWYPDSLTHWVMEFAGGGYFIHDASWQSWDTYGPGSEDQNWSASHGCVHTPTATMQWAYSWTPVGTPVTISY